MNIALEPYRNMVRDILKNGKSLVTPKTLPQKTYMRTETVKLQSDFERFRKPATSSNLGDSKYPLPNCGAKVCLFITNPRHTSKIN
jgi:hypothetical protein